MKIFLAGVGIGNDGCLYRSNSPEKVMKIFLAGLAGEGSRLGKQNLLKQRIYVLESFYYVKEFMIPYIEKYWDLLLDSGAFTFMENTKKHVDWDEYILKYADFIKEHNVKHFFELDIDSVVGIKEVERLRRKLESKTGKQCIPVWHKSRGKQYWLDMIKEYDYVAIGGIVTKEIKRKEHGIFKWFLQKAKENNCKVHGLGYTNLEGLKKYPFYSVDSTSWISGNKFGHVYKFDGATIKKFDTTKNQSVKSKETAINNFKEWIKFQKYAEKHL